MVIQANNTKGYASPVGLTADPVVFAPKEGKLHVLLVSRTSPPFQGSYQLPGGFVGEGENPIDCARRKLEEKTALTDLWLEQLTTYAAPERDPRGWIPSIAYLALTKAMALSEIESAASWFPVNSLPPLAFDHEKIIQDGVERLRGKIWYSNIAVALLPPKFTLKEARKLYESITEAVYDPSNFKRTLLSSGIIQESGEKECKTPGRPPHLYSFKESTPSWSIRRSRFPARAKDNSLTI